MKRLFFTFLSVPLAVVTTMAQGAAFNIISIASSKAVKQCCTLGGNHLGWDGRILLCKIPEQARHIPMMCWRRQGAHAGQRDIHRRGAR